MVFQNGNELVPIRNNKAFRSYKPPHFAVFGAICISRADTVLLVKGRTTGIWSFPKGHLRRGESGADAAMREVFEETGLLLSTRDSFDYKKLVSGGYYFYHLENELSVTVGDPKELSEVAWIPLGDLGSFHCNVDVESFRRRGLIRHWRDYEQAFADKIDEQCLMEMEPIN
jgi:8-oxo-dGTP pyrophosphatase MutT (NUDIX family)